MTERLTHRSWVIDGPADMDGIVPLPVRLTPREIAVLRLVSNGAQGHEAAQALGIGHETIRSHLKKAQIKLGARNRTHAACEALRQNLIL